MPLNLSPFSLEWLTHADSHYDHDETVAVEVERIPYQLPSEWGEAWAERLALRGGITLFRAYHDLEKAPCQLVPLIEVNMNNALPLFGAQVWLSGSANHREYWRGREFPPVDIIARPGRDTFRYMQNWSATVMVEGGVVSEMQSVVIDLPVLSVLLGEGETTRLLEELGLGDDCPTTVRSMPLHVSSALREAMFPGLRGPVRRMFAQSRVIEYLAILFTFVMSGKQITKERRHTARIRDLHDYLLTVEGRLPTMSELAQEFNLSARRLNAEFVAEYGQSIFSFITDYRLEQARVAIMESQTPLKLLSARLGYSHVNHFITAFKKKFGYSPGSLRSSIKPIR